MNPNPFLAHLSYRWRPTMIRLLCTLLWLTALAGCGDVYIAVSEHGAAAVTIEQTSDSSEPAPPTAVPPQTESTTRDHVAEIVAGFFVNTWGAVLLLALLAWLLFPTGGRNRWR